MSALAEFHDLLMPELPGCPVAMVNLHLRDTIREFCRKTSSWRQTLTAIDTVDGQASYSLDLPASAQLVRVTQLDVHAVLLWRSTEEDKPGSEELVPKYRITEPPFTLDANLGQLTLASKEIPTAAVTGGLVVQAALAPTKDAATVPDFLLGQYSDGIRYGTLSRLMVMAKKPWQDRLLAGVYRAEWNRALSRAAYQGHVGNTSRPLRVSKPPV